MVEVEQKFRGVDFDLLEQKLRSLGAVESERHSEADHYFNAPDRDFAGTDEALRLRRIGSDNFLTYKGPKLDTQTKTRTEVEAALAAGAQAAEAFLQVLKHLGYRPVAVVRKCRRMYRCRRDGFELTICLDDVEGVGKYAELEIRAPPERLEEAREILLHTAAELGLTISERRSYLELLLAGV